MIFKKLISIIISILISCVFLNGFSVYADDKSKTVNVTLGVDKTTINAGESFIETIGFSNYVNIDKGIQAFVYIINFDSSKFTCNVAPTSNSGISGELKITDPNTVFTDGVKHNPPNMVAILYMDHDSGTSPVTVDGPVFTVTFTANTDIESGVYDFTLKLGNSETFVDCSAATPANLRNVYPIFPANVAQHITVKGSAKDIKQFSFANIDSAGSINGKDITVKVPYVTDIKNLIANFVSSASSTVTVSGVTQISGTTKNDFTNPVTYTVTDNNGQKTTYTVTVTVAEQVVSSTPSTSSSSSSTPNPKTPNKVNLYLIIIFISLLLIVIAGILWTVLRKKN